MNDDQNPGAPTGTATSSVRSIFLLADSQLLFWKGEGGLFLDRVRRELHDVAAGGIGAAYLGASNGDVADFYDLFVGAMDGIGVRDCRMIHAEPSDEERAFLDRAHLILLAGGDVELGWRAFQRAGLVDPIIARYAAGAVLIGISAGAMQLGQRAFPPGGATRFETFRIVPLVIAVHDEPDWTDLAAVVGQVEGTGHGLGIPLGGGAVIHPDLTVEPVRKPLAELTLMDGALRRSLLLPPEGSP
jgi:hypothetical protein